MVTLLCFQMMQILAGGQRMRASSTQCNYFLANVLDITLLLYKRLLRPDVCIS